MPLLSGLKMTSLIPIHYFHDFIFTFIEVKPISFTTNTTSFTTENLPFTAKKLSFTSSFLFASYSKPNFISENKN
ncbi:hypothetical protein FIA58_019495 [Flavobacterium jejuense]|uniref:Uncharacterized protein n=1 Tax=Flavobacterium jejuense TaxID=1544455 RepID=A0ABX0IZ85_9FLAO|nr:hypothetical protein [Flavobacterium jejuense]NHN27868.1 hypothetical protein [Flavobacterium jejuense]